MEKNLGGGFLVWHLVAIVGAVLLLSIIGIVLYNVSSKEEPKQNNNPQPAQPQQTPEKRFKKNYVQITDKTTGAVYQKDPEEDGGLDLDDFVQAFKPDHKYEVIFEEQNDIASGVGKRATHAGSFLGNLYKNGDDFIEANGYYTFQNGERKYNDFDRKLSQQQLQYKQNDFFSKIASITLNGQPYYRNAKNKNEKATFHNLLTRLQTGHGDGLQIDFYQGPKYCFTDNNKPDLYVKSFQGEYTEFGFPKTGTIKYSDGSVVKLAPDMDVLREQNLEKLKQNVECIRILTSISQEGRQANFEYYTPNGGEVINGHKAKSFDSLPPLKKGQYCDVRYNLTTDNPFAQNDFQPIKTYTEYFDIIDTKDYPNITYAENFQLALAPKGFYNQITARYNSFSPNNIKKITVSHSGEVLFDGTDANNSDFNAALYNLDTTCKYLIEYENPIDLGDGQATCYRGYVTNTFLPYEGRLFDKTTAGKNLQVPIATNITDLWTNRTLQTQKVYNNEQLHDLRTALVRVPTQGA